MLPPVLSAPENNGNPETTRPTFTWSTVPGATGYNLMLSVNPTFIAPVQTIKVIGTSYTPTTDLPLRDASLLLESDGEWLEPEPVQWIILLPERQSTGSFRCR